MEGLRRQGATYGQDGSETGIDNAMAEGFNNIGAWILGRNML
jgi:hypothetical protein